MHCLVYYLKKKKTPLLGRSGFVYTMVFNANEDKTKTSNIVSYQGYVVYRYLPISPIILLKELVFHACL